MKEEKSEPAVAQINCSRAFWDEKMDGDRCGNAFDDRDRSGRTRTGAEVFAFANLGEGGEPEGGSVGGRNRKSSVGAGITQRDSG